MNLACHERQIADASKQCIFFSFYCNVKFSGALRAPKSTYKIPSFLIVFRVFGPPVGDPITKTRLESFLGTVRSYLTSFNMGSFIWTPFVPIITLFGTLKTGPNCLRLPKPIFFGAQLFGTLFFWEQLFGTPYFGLFGTPPS